MKTVLKFPLTVREAEFEVEVELMKKREPDLSRGPGTYYLSGSCETVGYEKALASVQGALEKILDSETSYLSGTLPREQLAEELRPLLDFSAEYLVVSGVRGQGPDHADQYLGVEEEIYNLGSVVRRVAREILTSAEKDKEAAKAEKRDPVVIYYRVESLTNMISYMQIRMSGRVTATLVDDVTEAEYKGEAVIAPERVTSLITSLAAVEGLSSEPSWDDEEEDRYSIAIVYQGQKTIRQWVEGSPRCERPSQIKELADELESLFYSIERKKV